MGNNTVTCIIYEVGSVLTRRVSRVFNKDTTTLKMAVPEEDGSLLRAPE